MIEKNIPPEIETEVIRTLSRGASREDLILSICERTNLNWPEAEAYVNNLEIEYSLQIDTRSIPFMTAFGILIILGGLALLAATMTGIVLSLQTILFGIETEDLVYITGYFLEGGQMLRTSLIFLPIALGMIIGGSMEIFRRIAPN